MRKIKLGAFALILAFVLMSCGGGGGGGAFAPDPEPPDDTPNLANFVGGLEPYRIAGRTTFLRLELTATHRRVGESFGVKVFCTPRGKAEAEITTTTVDNDVRKKLVEIESSNKGRPLPKAGYSSYAYVVPMDGTAVPEDEILVSAEVDARDMALFLAEINGWPVTGEPQPIPVPNPDPPDNNGGGDGNSIDVFGWVLAGVGVVGAIFCPTEYGKVVVTGDAVTPPPTPGPYLASAELSPSLFKDKVGRTKQFVGQCFDQFGRVLNGLSHQWTSSDESVATVSNSGLVTIVGVGTAIITFECEGGGRKVHATATVVGEENEPAPYLFNIELTPDQTSLHKGETQQFEVDSFDQNGAPISTTCVWVVAGDGSVSQSGRYSAPASIPTNHTAVVSVTCTDVHGNSLDESATVYLIADEPAGKRWGNDPYTNSDSYFIVTPDDGEWAAELGRDNEETQQFFGDLFKTDGNSLRTSGIAGKNFEIRFESSTADITPDGLFDAATTPLGTHIVVGKAILDTTLNGVMSPTIYSEEVTVEVVAKTVSGARRMWNPATRTLTLVKPN